ncbi:HlyD family efflux transporter periplasmic adaptor subunit [Acidithiobacillus sp. M4-SHS-6]|uniref:HlyD family efflux transporter periplasmic adaptor subunit n=1 Tax=Acidithiobacillus sp. M4-SHS-6 TaxID=3383024 RepID=UPI0039BEBC65
MATDESTTQRQGLRRSRRNLLVLALVLGFFLLLWLLWWWLVGSREVVSNDAYVTGNIDPIQAQAFGTIRRVFVQDTQFVHAGERLAAVWGDRSYLAMKARAAALGRVVRQVRQEFARVDELRQTIRARQAKLRELQEDLQRYRRARASGAVASIQIANTEQDIIGLRAEIKALRARLQAAHALVAHTTLQDNPQVQAAARAFEKAYMQWLRRDIRAPVSGFVAQRQAHPGQMIHPGERLFSIVPLQPLWVVANIKETEMAQVRPGEKVRMESSYYGSRVRYQGRVEGLSPGAGSAFAILPPDNATGNYIHIVERVPVRISLPAPELASHPLRPGLSMLVHIQTREGQSRAVLHPLTRTPLAGYESSLYRRQLQQVKAKALRIIHENS